MSRILISLALILIALLVGAMLTQDDFVPRMSDGSSLQSIALLTGYLILVSGGLVAGFRTQGWTLLRYLAIWLAIACLIALFYRMTH